MAVVNRMGDLFQQVVENAADRICRFEGNRMLARRFCPPPRHRDFIVVDVHYGHSLNIAAITEAAWRVRADRGRADADGRAVPGFP